MEGRNVGTTREKSPKQGLTSAKDLTIVLYIYILNIVYRYKNKYLDVF